MYKYKKEEINSLIRKNDNEKIQNKIMKIEKNEIAFTPKKINEKTIIPPKNISIYSSLTTRRENYPNNNSTAIKLKTNKTSNKTKYNTIQRFSNSNINKINKSLIAIKNSGSIKVLFKPGNAENHSLFISGSRETPYSHNKIEFETEKNRKYKKKC